MGFSLHVQEVVSELLCASTAVLFTATDLNLGLCSVRRFIRLNLKDEGWLQGSIGFLGSHFTTPEGCATWPIACPEKGWGRMFVKPAWSLSSETAPQVTLPCSFKTCLEGYLTA